MTSKKFSPNYFNMSLMAGALIILLISLFSETVYAQTFDHPIEKNTWYKDYKNTNTVIVFVHGIFGDSNTFLYHDKRDPTKDVFWPDLLSQDQKLRKASIFMSGYFTSWDAAGFGAEEAAEEVFSGLRVPNVDTQRSVLNHQNIVFIMHSTGGIVVRQMLLKHSDDFKEKHIGLLLIASPSIGSQWADRLSPVIDLANSKLASQLRENNTYLDDLDVAFKNLLSKKALHIDGLEAFENHFIVKGFLFFSRDQVVDKDSAARYFPNPILLPDTDHFSTVKPNNFDNASNKMLSQFYSDNFAGETITYTYRPPVSAVVRVDRSQRIWQPVTVSPFPNSSNTAVALSPLDCSFDISSNNPPPGCVITLGVPSPINVDPKIGDYRLHGITQNCFPKGVSCDTAQSRLSTVGPSADYFNQAKVVVAWPINPNPDITSTTIVSWKIDAHVEQLGLGTAVSKEESIAYGQVIEVLPPAASEYVTVSVSRLNSVPIVFVAGQDPGDEGIVPRPIAGYNMLRYEILGQ